jgi:hypothetical protein
VSGEQPAQRSPFQYAADYEDRDTESIPLITPFQRYVLEGLDSVKRAQGEFTAEMTVMRQQISEIAPHVISLKNDAALAKKVLTYAKYVGFGLATRYFPEFAASVAKYAPAILDAAGKATP